MMNSFGEISRQESQRDCRETVLVIVPSLGIGGREKIAIQTVRSFEKLGYRPILIVFQKRELEYLFHGEIINIQVPAKNNATGKIYAQIRRSVRVLRLRRRYRVRYVYSLGETANITNILSGMTHRGKSIISLHGFTEVKRGWLYRFLFSRASSTVCISQDMREELLTFYPSLRNIQVIENGYDIVPLKKSEKVFSAAPRLAAMGRLTPVKGFDRLIKSFRRIHDILPGATLTIIGDGEDKEKLRELTDEINLRESVLLKGYMANPLAVLPNYDLYVMTSFHEGFPNAIIEAMSCGLPVVAADCRSGPREILSETYTSEPVRGIRHAKYGVLVDNEQVGFEERFAEAVLQLWRDMEEMETYSKAGVERAMEYSAEQYQEKLRRLLDECDCSRL